MIKEIHISLLPKQIFMEEELLKAVSLLLKIEEKRINHIEVLKRSIDARRIPVKYQIKALAYVDEEFKEVVNTISYKNVEKSKDFVVIIGSGPAGLFAALQALELGVKPIIFERGKDVRTRRKDLATINKEGVVNPESNYCFGEGGAGTYSDGKLYTRSKKRGNVKRVLEALVYHGADKNILVDAHPHIGTNKLPKLIASIREQIVSCGGEIHFDSKMTDIVIEEGKVKGIAINGNLNVSCGKLILATGHSARDIYFLLDKKGIKQEYKSFAMGVRVEHSQMLIDKIQYKCTDDRGEYLPPASYSLVEQTRDRGVYSFCMCPGGVIAPCATSEGEVVTNGWSPSKRNNPFSNSGIVTEVRWSDISDFHHYGALAGVYFQKSIEEKSWKMGGQGQKVPAQRMVDFVEGIKSKDLPKTSYYPGITSVQLADVLPQFVTKALREGFKAFKTKMKEYYTNEAVLHAVESRTSSPVRIPRDKESFEHISVKGLYPIGEGAGYAGGIVSAAIDGQRCIEAIVNGEILD